MSDTLEDLDPHFARARDRLESTRARFEAQAQRYRALAVSADPEFRDKYLELARSIDAFLRTFSAQTGDV